MLHFWTSLAAGHDGRLLTFAALVCVVGLTMSVRLFARAFSGDSRQPTWVALSAIGAGASLWAGHFLAMTGWRPDLDSGYDPIRTSFAFMTAMAGATAAFWVMAGARRSWSPALAGGLFAIGATAALSAGLNAFLTQGLILWNPLPLLTATPVSVGFATAAFIVARDLRGWRRQLPAGLLLFLSAAAAHAGGMAGVSIAADPSALLAPGLIGPDMLALVVTLVAGLSITAGFAVAEPPADEALDQNRLLQILDAVSEAVAYCDNEDRLVFWNRSYAEVGRHSSMPLKPGTPFRTILETALSQGGYSRAVGREEEWLAERMAQHLSPMSVHEHALNDGRWLRIEEQRTAEGGVIMVLVDITDLKRDAQMLNEAKEEAERANRAKSEFLANMSHEIRTPLNGVIGLTDSLSRTELAAQQKEIVEIIRSSGVTLERLLTDVLDLARIESGRLEIRNEAFRLSDIIRQVAGLAQLRARDKGVGFRLDMDPAAESVVDGDPDRLKQILLNLLSNAVKFTEAGEVSLTVSHAAHLPGGGFRFEVRDTGVGFSTEDKARLFQRFEQADGSITRRFGGSGLGLAIVWQLTGLMGGNMDAESVEGEGATFVVELPLPAASAAPAGSAPPVEAPSVSATFGARPPRVLLAEDHPTNRKVVELLLQATGAELTSVEDGAQALEAFGSGGFDLVLMDMQMPVMDGLAATRAIRRREKALDLPRTPIVALTANALPEHVRASSEAGADAHLAKPITAATLLPLMAGLLTDGQAGGEALEAVAAA